MDARPSSPARSAVVFLSMVVLAPLAAALVGLSGLGAGVAAAALVDAWLTGATPYRTGFDESGAPFGLVLIAVSLGAAILSRLTRKAPSPLRFPGRLARLRSWMWHHTWWMDGLLFLVLARLMAHRAFSNPLLAGGLWFAAVLWVFLTVTLLVLRSLWSVVRWVGRRARQSWLLAAALAAPAAFIVASLAVELGPEAIESSRQLASNVRAQPILPALSSAWQPVPQRRSSAATLLGALGGEDTFGGWGSDDSRDAFEECYESLPSHVRASAVALLRRLSVETDADELIHLALFNVCVHGKRPDKWPDYFYVALRNRAVDAWHRDRRSCSIDEIPEPTCPVPDSAGYVSQEELA